jgi:hypothetical protein
MKKQHLVVYDYGMGGVWAVIFARSEEEILAKYPALQVIHEWPAWMTDEEYERTLANQSFDVDDEPRGWILEMARESDDGR